MTDSGASFNRPYKPFGLNIKVPEIGEHTIRHAKEAIENIVKSPAEPLFQFLEENEEVFNGDLTYNMNKVYAESFTIGSAMRMEDEKINGMPSSFDMHF